MARPTILNAEAWRQALAAEGDKPLSVARLSVEAFAAFVQSKGRASADAMLRKLEQQLAAELPSDALLGKLGSHEYAALLPETSPETALRIFDQLVRQFIRHRDPQWPSSLSLSVGIASQPAHSKGLGEGNAKLLLLADEALLRARYEGSGRACLYSTHKMLLKANYYPRSQLERLRTQAQAEGRSEAEILRQALQEYLEKKL